MRVLVASTLALLALTGAAAAEEAPAAAAKTEVASAAPVAVAGDPEKGAVVFKKCMACHAIGPGAKTKVGPPLNGIVGAHWAHFAGYPYSEEIKEGATAGKVWEPALLEEWVTNPKTLAPKTKMAFAGVKSAEERANLIAFLAQYNAEGEKK
ncbi:MULTISPECIES: cytochrome c family protein [unclassified Xanthobacter]|uniref:c-type cytochrome n=1 Tax=unclassified Xanthobacter TaxID=2623496 RepID=UPI001F1585F6|nr:MULTISPECIES: c-type cytochrome [unclassified Xanthobacter]